MEQFACTIQRLLSVDNFSANHEERGLFTRYAFTYIINIRVIYGCQLLTPDTIEDSLLYVARIDSYTCYYCTISQSILFPYFTLYFYNDNDLLYCELLCWMEPFWTRLFNVFTKKSVFHHKIYLSWYDSLSSLSTWSHAICMYRVRDISFQLHVG